MSETEVTNIRNPGDLIFSLDNEIMTIPVKAGENIAPGNIVSIDDNNYAVKGINTNTDASKGYGVCIFEGANNTSGASGDLLVQIATGNAYVACKAGAVVKPFKNIRVDANSSVVDVEIVDVGAVTTVAQAKTEMIKILGYMRYTIGRSYGNPGEMVNPKSVANNGVVVVRLGRD